MKERKLGGKILKSAIAILMAAAVLVLSLPAFKMDAWANNVSRPIDVVGPSATELAEEPSAKYVVGSDQVWDTENNRAVTEGSVNTGDTILVGGRTEYTFNNGVLERRVTFNDLNGWEKVANRTLVKFRINGETNLLYAYAYLYTITNNASFTMNDNSFVLTMSESSGETAASNGTVPAVDPNAIKTWQAKIDADNLALEIQRQEVAAQNAKIAQAQIDNLYFKNENEAKALGMHMIILPNHSVVHSTIKGDYRARSIPGFAARQIEGQANPNLYVQTWDITNNKSVKARASIDGKVTDLNGKLVGAVQINIGEKQKDGTISYESASTDPVANILFAVPDAGAKYVIVQVIGDGNGNGNIHVFDQLTVADGVITLPLPIGQAAYALVKLPAAAQ